MTGTKIPGLRQFLLIVLEMVSDGKTEMCDEIEVALQEGIATKLYNSYPTYFQQAFNSDNIEFVDNYYKKWVGSANGAEYKKYSCKSDGGLNLIIALALNEIY